MALKLVFSNTVGIRIKGSINDPAGKPQAFDFGLTCKRLTQAEVGDVMREQDRPAIDFLGGRSTRPTRTKYCMGARQAAARARPL